MSPLNLVLLLQLMILVFSRGAENQAEPNKNARQVEMGSMLPFFSKDNWLESCRGRHNHFTMCLKLGCILQSFILVNSSKFPNLSAARSGLSLKTRGSLTDSDLVCRSGTQPMVQKGQDIFFFLVLFASRLRLSFLLGYEQRKRRICWSVTGPKICQMCKKT